MTDHLIIAGAQRSGTTLMHRLLDQHPEIQMAKPVHPEPKFFLDAANRDVAAYRALFPGWSTCTRVLGEKSTSYLESREVPGRIRSMLPGARILVILRDPIERALSNYRFSRANGIETLSIEDAFYHEERRLTTVGWSGVSTCPVAYLTRGRYAEQLERWREHFPASQLHVVLFERLIRDPTVVKSVFQFAGVDADFVPALPSAPVNPSDGDPVVLESRLQAYLLDYFSGPNHKLTSCHALDLSCWPSFKDQIDPSAPWCVPPVPDVGLPPQKLSPEP